MLIRSHDRVKADMGHILLLLCTNESPMIKFNSEKLPVLICGMWQATEEDPESGARILIQDGLGGKQLLEGYSDENGEFRGLVPASYSKQSVRFVISEPSFLWDSYDQIKIERWGLFLPVRARKDLNYNGSKGAKNIDFNRWNSWNESHEFSQASEKTHSAARRAKVAWPVNLFGIFVAAVSGAITLFLNPILAVLVTIVVAVGFNLFSKWLLVNGY